LQADDSDPTRVEDGLEIEILQTTNGRQWDGIAISIKWSPTHFQRLPYVTWT